MTTRTQSGPVPAPAPMPVDRESWYRQLNLSNFINTYCQYRDLQNFSGCRRVLIVGPGNGFDALVLRWRGYDVQTLDIDETFNPDIIGSVQNLHMFSDQQFDAVIASHVLEHLAEAHLDRSLAELSRVARNALIYLPVHGKHLQLKMTPGFGQPERSVILDLFNYFERPDGVTPRYMEGQHYWEVGMRGFRVKDVTRRLSQFFVISQSYRNTQWIPSYNFVLNSLSAKPTTK